MEEYNDGDTVSDDMTVTLPHFENIRKETVGETYRYFKKIIEKKSVKNLDELISESTDLSLFDQSLRLLLIDSLRLENEVFKILLSQNEYQIKKVLQCKWFFKNLSAEFCTKQIFPHVSFSVRCKIINKLSRHLESTEEAEKYFAFIRANYGNERADYILPRCGPQFILAYVEKEKPTFDHNNALRIFLNICRRYPEIGVHILFTIFDNNKKLFSLKYKKIICYLAAYHPDLMVPFLKKHYSLIDSKTFCRKLTKKLVVKLRKDLFPNFIVDLLMFHETTLFSMLSFEEQGKYITLIVRSVCPGTITSGRWTNLDYRLACLLKLVPQNKRQELIDSAFKEIFNRSFMEYPKCWSCPILETLPTETREMYVEKLEGFAEAGTQVFRKNVGYNCFSPDGQEQFLYLYGARRAFDKFKEMLKKCPSPNKRENILFYLVKSCGINKDVEVLQEVVEFVVKRHRNDDNSVIFRFMEAICENFSVSTLNSDIFEKVDDLAYFCNLKGRKNNSISNDWKERHIHYLFENDSNGADTHIKNFFESALIKSYRQTFVRDLRRKHSKLFILALSKEAVAWIQNKSNDEGNREFLLGCMLDTFKEYNKVNKKKRIFLRDIPGLEEILKEKTKKLFGEVGGEDWPLDIWETYYNDVSASYDKAKFLYYIFKREPDSIEKHLKGILKMLFSFPHFQRVQNAFFGYLMKTVSFLGLTENMKEIILTEFKNGESIDSRKTALFFYSQISTIEEFSKATEKYLPKQEKLGEGTEEGFDEIQILVPGLIKHVTPRWKNFELILKFFMGDFLKIAFTSFHSCCFHTRCDVVIPFLKKRLEATPPKVSYIKGIILLVLELSDLPGRTEICVEWWNKHKHYSIRNIVLRYVCRIFLEYKTEKSFGLFEKCILDSDETIIEALPEFQKIPGEFLNEYVDALWRFSGNLKPSFRTQFRETLLGELNEKNINLISDEFCAEIIKNHLFDESSDTKVNDFAVLYLTGKPEAVKNRVFVVLNVIKHREPDVLSVCSFFDTLIENTVGKPGDCADLFTVILENWPQYPAGVLYRERVLFTYHSIYHKLYRRFGDGDAVAVELGKELKKFYSSVDNLKDLIFLYVESLKSFLSRFRLNENLVIFKELVAGSQNRTVAMLAILSLSDDMPNYLRKNRKFISEKKAELQKGLHEFIKILESYNDDVLEIYLGSILKFEKC